MYDVRSALRPGSILYLFDPYCSNVQSEEYNPQICDFETENRPCWRIFNVDMVISEIDGKNSSVSSCKNFSFWDQEHHRFVTF